MPKPIYTWDWIDGKHVGISEDRVRVESKSGAVEYVRERTCHFDQTDEIPTISGMIRVWECSNCGRECEELNGVYEYCPHCGAKVIEE